ncbi:MULTISPECIES: hypothetical protein [unclassified Haladaptatus]|uniref:cupredoxin domain-containing protein n=1 Tax=unclassified Haladaptatus TaxID=2622732 RepID=UPI00209C1D32|nr:MULTISPECIES: hypothetical protein [unclassified Haladaptatus]MCO8246165.1 hypothetical protein [Haladaptatus sp. AB643]MCO8254215.1 hypothetical protein [Haladaptatus sp. AB618]
MTGSKLSRRRFVQVALGTGALVGLARGQTATFELGGQVSGWLGQSPEPLADKTNPTIQMVAGKDYVIGWENLDGNSHNIAIGDGKGNILKRTEVIEMKGATQTLEFTATTEMETYFSEFDPETMRGNLIVLRPTTTMNGTANGTTGTMGEMGTSSTTGATTSPPSTSSPTASTSPSTTETTTTASGDTSSSTTDGGGLPGFGWLAALGGIAAFGYLLRRKE